MAYEEEEEYESEEDRRNDEWLKDNFFDLVADYPREWIAVMGQRIIARGATRIEVEDKAKAIAGDREYSVYFIPPTATFTDVGYTTRQS
ncbi:MAG: DUF5678 domain-containing protein [Methanomassiliicoccales archaeon]